jgi:chromosome segregation ATPase
MQFFTKSKFKRKAGQAGVGSQLALGGINNQSLARISAAGPRAENEDALAQYFLNIIETQTTQINELTHELKLKESALEYCLGSQGNELQRKMQEVDHLENELRQQDRLLQSHIQNTRQLRKARADLEKVVSQQQLQLVNAQCQEAHLEDRLQAKRNEAGDVQARLENELAEERAARDAAQSRARHEANTLGEQLDQKGQRIHELDEQVQIQTETIDQTRLALNRTRNELTQEKRKARQAIEESATKSQQLEFVQQQCARLQAQLHDITVITRKTESLFRSGKEMEAESVITEKDFTERVGCAQQ